MVQVNNHLYINNHNHLIVRNRRNSFCWFFASLPPCSHSSSFFNASLISRKANCCKMSWDLRGPFSLLQAVNEKIASLRKGWELQVEVWCREKSSLYSTWRNCLQSLLVFTYLMISFLRSFVFLLVIAFLTQQTSNAQHGQKKHTEKTLLSVLFWSCSCCVWFPFWLSMSRGIKEKAFQVASWF